MTVNGWLQILVYFAILFILVKPLGAYMARIFQGERTFLTKIISPIERFFYRVSGIKADEEMNWKTYTVAMLIFSLFGIVFLFILQRI